MVYKLYDLTEEEIKIVEGEDWKSQMVISNSELMGLRKRPYAFTESGVSMLSSVLKSKTAVSMSVRIIQSFIYTKRISKKLELDLKKHNEQYTPVEIHTFSDTHDRFLILDEKEVYHIGASLKDLGKKWFAFSKFEKGALQMLNKLGNKKF